MFWTAWLSVIGSSSTELLKKELQQFFSELIKKEYTNRHFQVNHMVMRKLLSKSDLVS